jgi:hypothetical protein
VDTKVGLQQFCHYGTAVGNVSELQASLKEETLKNKKLERELIRKEKALAEAAAILTAVFFKRWDATEHEISKLMNANSFLPLTTPLVPKALCYFSLHRAFG